VDRLTYLQRVQEVEASDRPKRPRLLGMLGPGGGRTLLKDLSAHLGTVLESLEAIEMPADDAPALTTHFIEPQRKLFQYLVSAADSAPRWLSIRGALRLLDNAPQPTDGDQTFCDRYGLTRSPRTATFSERAAAADVELQRTSGYAAAPTSEQMRRVRWGGARPSSVLLLALGLGAFGTPVGARQGIAGGLAIGVVTAVLVGGILAVRLRRIGKTVTTGQDDVPNPVSVAAVLYRVSYWSIAVVSERDPDVSVAANIAWKGPGRPDPTSFSATAIGNLQPGGRFAVIADDGRVFVSAKDSHRVSWPPFTAGKKDRRARRSPHLRSGQQSSAGVGEHR
jgi:hypothetical protein